MSVSKEKLSSQKQVLKKMSIKINSKNIKIKEVVDFMDYLELIGIEYELIFELKEFKEHE
jgi:hypothetical protein